MKANLLFFAGLREALGLGKESVELPDGVTNVAALRAHLAGRGGAWAEQFAASRNLRAAVNQDMVGADAPIKSGDEIAFVPPVTGG